MTNEEIKIDIEKSYLKEINTFVKIAKLIYDIGDNFTKFDAGELSEKQMVLSGYKYYLAEFISELYRMKELYSIKTKEFESGNWDRIKKEMEEEGIVVKNKEQIKNRIYIENTKDLIMESTYGSMFLKFKLKLSAVDDVLTSIAQRIKLLQQSNMYQHD